MAIVAIMIHLSHITVRFGFQLYYTSTLVAVEEVIPPRRPRQQVRRGERPAPAVRAAQVEQEARAEDARQADAEADAELEELAGSECPDDCVGDIHREDAKGIDEDWFVWSNEAKDKNKATIRLT